MTGKKTVWLTALAAAVLTALSGCKNMPEDPRVIISDISSLGDDIGELIEIKSEQAEEIVDAIFGGDPIENFKKNTARMDEDKADYERMKEMAAEVVRCFDEKDADGIKALLCEYTLNNTEDLDGKIQAMLDAYEGKSQSYRYHHPGYDGSIIDSVWSKKHLFVRIDDIKTDAGKTYSIVYNVYLVYENAPDHVGMCTLSVADKEADVKASLVPKDD